jgi:hypothetical protein
MAYRDDRQALEMRREELRKELAEVESRLSSTQPRRPLYVLDDVRIASPCHMSWEDMPGDERVRFCHACEKRVYNLSAMTREQGEQLLDEHEGEPCVRLYQRADGTVITSDCEVGTRARRSRRRALGAALGVGAATAACAAAFFAQVGRYHPPRETRPVDAASRARDERARDIARELETNVGTWSMGVVSNWIDEDQRGSSQAGDKLLPPQPRKDRTR